MILFYHRRCFLYIVCIIFSLFAVYFIDIDPKVCMPDLEAPFTQVLKLYFRLKNLKHIPRLWYKILTVPCFLCTCNGICRCYLSHHKNGGSFPLCNTCQHSWPVDQSNPLWLGLWKSHIRLSQTQARIPYGHGSILWHDTGCTHGHLLCWIGCSLQPFILFPFHSSIMVSLPS